MTAERPIQATTVEQLASNQWLRRIPTLAD